LLNRNLACGYRAIIATIVYSEVLKRASYTIIGEELERHAVEEFRHAKEIAGQIASLGGIPCVMLEVSKASMAAIATSHPGSGSDEEQRSSGNYQYPIHPDRIATGWHP